MTGGNGVQRAQRHLTCSRAHRWRGPVGTRTGRNSPLVRSVVSPTGTSRTSEYSRRRGRGKRLFTKLLHDCRGSHHYESRQASGTRVPVRHFAVYFVLSGYEQLRTGPLRMSLASEHCAVFSLFTALPFDESRCRLATWPQTAPSVSFGSNGALTRPTWDGLSIL